MSYGSFVAKKKADAKLVVGYVRVSTEDQSIGPEQQRIALEQWCKANDATLVAVHSDLGVSGGSPLDKRPGLLEALDALKTHGAGVLLVAKRDRLARDVIVAAMVERLAERDGARVLTADGTGNVEGPEGQLMRGIVDLFAQYERALIRARTKAALATKKAKGERTGGIPFGYRVGADGVTLVPEAKEQDAIRVMHAMRDAGVGVQKIVAKVNERGICDRRIHRSLAYRVLDRVA